MCAPTAARDDRCFNARSARASALHNPFINPDLWPAAASSLLLQVAIVYVPLLQDAFDTAPLDATDWLLSAGLASVVLWSEERRKLARRAVNRSR